MLYAITLMAEYIHGDYTQRHLENRLLFYTSMARKGNSYGVNIKRRLIALVFKDADLQRGKKCSFVLAVSERFTRDHPASPHQRRFCNC